MFSFINKRDNSELANKTAEFLRECFYAQYKELANKAYNNQAETIDASMEQAVLFATAERTRTRKSISLTGEYFKQVLPMITTAVVKYFAIDKQKELTSQQVATLLAALKPILVVELQ